MIVLARRWRCRWGWRRAIWPPVRRVCGPTWTADQWPCWWQSVRPLVYLVVVGALGTAALVVLAITATAHAAPDGDTAAVHQAIVRAAARYGVDAGLLTRIAWCESRLNPAAVNAADGSAGLYQFQPGTWAWATQGAGNGVDASRLDPDAAALAAAWVLTQPDGARHWGECAR